MSYTPRLYDAIVRDLLTTLTGGTVAETMLAPPDGVALVPAKLRDRPVRRVSHLEGFVGPADKQVSFRFTAADFELVASGADGTLDTIRFRDGGRRPTPGSQLTVNYYPVETRPASPPLDDLAPGSVVRTLVETVAFELAVLYQHLAAVYDSAFVETATDRSLEKVVALVGVRRLPAGFPIAKLRLQRRPGTPGRVTVPAGTAVTNAKGARYLTQEEIILEPGEANRDVVAVAETQATPDVEAGGLDRPEISIAGIESVSNPQPTARLAAAETDEQLRRRAKGALAGSGRGTLDALKFHLLSMAEVKDVTLTEAPDGRWGEVRADIAYAVDTPDAHAAVAERIRLVKPAGVLVIPGAAARRRVAVRVALTLAGTGVGGGELADIQAGVAQRLIKAIGDISPGGVLRRAQLLSAVMADARVVDATVTLTPDGGAAAPELALAPGEVVDLAGPVSFDTATAETAGAVAQEATVSAMLPVHLAPGATAAATKAAIETAFASHLASRSNGAPLNLDGLAAAIRDDTRFALIRAEATLTVEAGDRFLQLSDGLGEYMPGPGERLSPGRIDIDIREGTA